MSRQFDEYMEGKFELFGETYELVEPENFEELLQALRVRDVIQNGINGLMHDEDSSGLSALLEEQDGYIREYLDSCLDHCRDLFEIQIFLYGLLKVRLCHLIESIEVHSL